MTDPMPAPPSPSPGPKPRARLALLGGGAGLLVALGATTAFILLGDRPGTPPEHPEAHGHEHEHGHEHGGHEPPAKPQAPQASMEVLRHTDRAARAAATGDREKARKELGEALMLAPGYAPALLVHVCLALEEGNDTEAGTALEQLKAAAPGSAEVKLLEGLREARRTPGTGWQQAFRQAWASLGRPDFEKSQLLPGATPLPPDPADANADQAAWERATSDEVRLMLALASRRLDADKALFLLKQVPKLEDPALYLAVMDALRGDALPESSFEEARRVFRQQLEKLAAANPRSMQLHLLLLLGDTEQGSEMSAKEIDALERVAALPVWRESSFSGMYQQARKVLKDAGVTDAAAMAMTVATRGIAERGSWILRTRNVGTRGGLSPEGLKRLGAINRDIGARLVEQPTVTERMTGLQLVRGGAQDRGDEIGRKLALAHVEKLEAAIENFRKTAMARWPLYSLTEELMDESTRDEPAYLQSFMPGGPAQAAGTQP